MLLFSVLTLFYYSWKTCLLIGENVVFLVIFDTCDVMHNWSISLLPPIVLDNLFGYRSCCCSWGSYMFKGSTLYYYYRNPNILLIISVIPNPNILFIISIIPYPNIFFIISSIPNHKILFIISSILNPNILSTLNNSMLFIISSLHNKP